MAISRATRLLVLGFFLAVALLVRPVQSLPGPQHAAAQAGDALYLPLLTALTPPVISSFDLIEEALARGEIDEETALVYQVFALFADPRLPAQFEGSGDAELDHGVLRAAAGQFASLAPETRALLMPFFLPPIYQGSWHDRYDLLPQSAQRSQAPAAKCPHQAGAYFLKDGWSCTDSGNGKVRVWWRDDMPAAQKKAELVAVVIDIDIWDSLTGVMGREPLPDTGPLLYTDPNGEEKEWGNGGDGKLDIYLVDPPIRAAALTVAYPPACDKVPAFMVIPPTVSEKDLPSVVAHEFMHAIQYTYNVAEPCDGSEYRWLEEAAAHWAIDYVYPDDNYEQGYWPRAFFGRTVNESIETSLGYDAYLLPLYLARTYQPGIIKTIWEQMTQFDSLEAIERALDDKGGLEEVWPQFALANWNQGPIDNYLKWDGIKLGAITVGTPRDGINHVETIDLSNKHSGEYKLDVDVPHLAAQYYHFRFAGSEVRSVAFQNSFNISHGLEPTVRIQALVKIEGQEWAIEDWTELQSEAYCRDRKAERVQELVIIVSNSTWQDREHVFESGSLPRLAVSNIGCWRWSGSVTSTQGFLGGFTVTTQADVTFEHHEFEGLPPGLGNQIYYPVDGSVVWQITGTDKFGCSASGGPHVIPLENLLGELSAYNLDITDLNHRAYFGVGSVTNVQLPYTRTCMGTSTTVNAGGVSWLFMGSPGPAFGSDGTKMEDTATVDVGSGNKATYTWHFTAVSEP